MAEVILLQDLLPESPETVTLVDDQTAKFQPQFGRGWTQRNSFADPRWRIKRTYKGMRGADISRLKTALLDAQGGFNTVYATPSHAQRGSFPSSEQMSNNTFASGTTGWSSEANWSHVVTDQILRSSNNGTGAAAFFLNRPAALSSLTPWMPYLMRYFTRLGPGIDPASATCRIDDYSVQGGLSQAYASLLDAVHVPPANGQLRPGIALLTPASGYLAGTFIDTLWPSLTQCAVVDNSPNTALQSDDFSNASWTKTAATATANTSTAPDGTATADTLTDTAVNSTHIAEQSFTVSAGTSLDYVAQFCIKAGTKTWAWVALVENTGGTSVLTYVNLSTGALGTLATQANWSNGRAYSHSLGNGWYRVTIVARKTNAATTLRARVGISNNADLAASYLGDGTGTIIVWRGAFLQGRFPFLPAATTTTASTGTGQVNASTINIAGLPASTNGLLLPGDWVDINQELKQVVAPLNSTGDGLGVLRVRPKLYTSPAHEDPVAIGDPMGRFMISDSISYDEMFGVYASLDLTLDEVFS
jgi:hypothetical protein